jgi:uncharacterized sulfatase
MGKPNFTSLSDIPSYNELEKSTYAAFADMDASPTKAWLVSQYSNPDWQWYYDLAFGKRPAEELYDLRKDPDQTVNLADNPEYKKIKEELAEKLMKVLKEKQDPRVTGDGKTFDSPPFTNLPENRQKKK